MALPYTPSFKLKRWVPSPNLSVAGPPSAIGAPDELPSECRASPATALFTTSPKTQICTWFPSATCPGMYLPLTPHCKQTAGLEGPVWSQGQHRPNSTLRQLPFLFKSKAGLSQDLPLSGPCRRVPASGHARSLLPRALRPCSLLPVPGGHPPGPLRSHGLGQDPSFHFTSLNADSPFWAQLSCRFFKAPSPSTLLYRHLSHRVRLPRDRLYRVCIPRLVAHIMNTAPSTVPSNGRCSAKTIWKLEWMNEWYIDAIIHSWLSHPWQSKYYQRFSC